MNPESINNLLKEIYSKVKQFLENNWWTVDQEPIVEVRKITLANKRLNIEERKYFLTEAIAILKNNIELSNRVNNEKDKAKIMETSFNDFIKLKKFIINLLFARELIGRLEIIDEKIKSIKELDKLIEYKINSKYLNELMFKIKESAYSGESLDNYKKHIDEIEKIVEAL